ncbi:MAG: hypothetical protein V4471_06925 [Pseudomonadota bacterium]
MCTNNRSQALQCRELLQCYKKALENYCKGSARTGCLPTFFTKFRHSFKEYPALYKLRKALEIEQNIDIAFALIVDHFISKTSNFNNHSFNNYFIDELRKSFKQVDWDCFTPKAVKKYTGLLYRGDTRHPSLIFGSGFTEKCSSNFDSDYQKYYNEVGISASKDIDVAVSYAINSKEAMLKRILRGQIQALTPIGSYVYVLNYHGSDGFDLLKTGQARGLNFSSIFHRDRSGALGNKEVNIKGSIASKHILRAFELTNDGFLVHENSNYISMNQENSSNLSFRS